MGVPKFHFGLAELHDQIGQVTGLAWTSVGGELLTIEASMMPGKGKMLHTGKLGEVMQESIHAAMTVSRSLVKKFKVMDDFYEKNDFHVHVPEGAVPKDGPSAGLAIATALVSALTKIPVNKYIAMTGEITLRGRALEIGGVKSKVLAAHRAGIKTVILPKDNQKDMEDVPDFVKKDIKFIFVEHIDEVLKNALVFPDKTHDYAGMAAH